MLSTFFISLFYEKIFTSIFYNKYFDNNYGLLCQKSKRISGE